MILLTNAYSGKNAGDGLLVDLSIQLLRDAGVDSARIALVSRDPESFVQHRALPSHAALCTRALRGELCSSIYSSMTPLRSVADSFGRSKAESTSVLK